MLKFSSLHLFFSSLLVTLSYGQLTDSPAQAVQKSDPVSKQIPTTPEALEAQASNRASKTFNKTNAETIAKRIKAIQKLQANHLKKIASGEIKPQANLLNKWPKIQKDVFALRRLLASLNNLGPNDRKRIGIEVNILDSLNPIGDFLVPASHPKFSPRNLDEKARTEMKRIGLAVENLSYGDRREARPLKVLAPYYAYTLVGIPVPIVVRGKPEEKIYLVAMTGGAFANDLSLIELQTDKQGIARTSWVSIGDAVGDCNILLFAESAIERQPMQIKVVSPSLKMIEGLPLPDKALLTPSTKTLPSVPKLPSSKPSQER